MLGFALRSTQHIDPRTYFVIIEIDRVIREYGMSKRHLKASRLKYLDRQKALFDRAKPELVDRYLGKFVAFEDGRILDRDLDRQKLVKRVYRQYSDRDLLIERVCSEELPLSVVNVSHSHNPQFRIPGLLTGTLGNAFFEPLPEDELQQWE